MKRRSSFAEDSTSVVVERELGTTAYDNVVVVADAIANVTAVAGSIDNVNAVAPHINDVDTIAPYVDDIAFLANAYPAVTPSTGAVLPVEGTTLSSIYSHSDSSCMLVGGAITDNGNGTVTVALGSARMRRNPATEHDPIDTVALDEQILTISTGTNIIYINYPSVGPAVYAVTNDLTVINMLDKLGIFFINKDVNKLLITDARFSGVDHVGKHQRFMFDTEKFVRASGGFLTETGTSLHLQATASKWYFQLNPMTAPAIETDVSGTFEYYYTTDSGVTWTESNATLLDSANYNDITSGLVALGTGKYGAHWVYLLLDHVTPVYAVVYGQAEYLTENAARASNVPSNVPPSISDVGVLLGRLITRQGITTSFIEVASAFTQKFSTALITDHNDLAGMQGGTVSEYYHLTAAQHTETINARKQYAKVTLPRDIVAGDVSAGKATITLTAEENLYGRIVITDTGALTSVAGELIVGVSVRDLIVVNNDDQDYKAWVGSGGFVTVKSGTIRHLYCDGTNVSLYDENGKLTTNNFMQVAHQVATGVSGGSTAATTRNIRPLTAELYNTIDGASLVSNIVTLPAGKFKVKGNSRVYRSNAHKLFLYNITDTTDQIIGTSEVASSGDSSLIPSFIDGIFEITATKTFRLEHFTTTAFATSGLGIPTSDGSVETYAILNIWKVD